MHRITDRMILEASVLIVLLCLIFGICFRYRYRLAEPVFVQQNTAVTAIFDDSEAKPGWYADAVSYTHLPYSLVLSPTTPMMVTWSPLER